ncbi:MAG: type IX secretion system protein PorQ [Ignavibacteria bacterium]
MKKIKSVLAVLVLSIFLIYNTGFSQNNSTYNFLKLDIGARASALGGSFNSATNDVNSIFYNPAGLSTLTNKQASFGFFKYLLDVNSGNISFSQRYKDAGYFGAGIRYINYGSFEKFDEQSVSQGTFGANELALSLGYSNLYKNNFHYGVNLKLIYSKIDIYSSAALAADFGVLYVIPASQWNFGLSVLNAGGQLSKYNSTSEQLPLDVRIGVSKKLEHLPLRVHFEVSNLTEKVEDQENNFKEFLQHFENLSVGGEFDFSDNVKFRIGYNNGERQNLETGSSLGIAGFSTGFGIKLLDNYTVDYAFNSLGKIGSMHRIDVALALK